jgi:hypothetical protein
MKLRLLPFVLCAIFMLHGAQQDTQKITTLKQALQLTEKYNLVIFSHNIDDGKEGKKIEVYKGILEEFRKGADKNIADYVLLEGGKMWRGVTHLGGVNYPPGIAWSNDCRSDYGFADRDAQNIKNICVLDAVQYSNTQGLILYCITQSDKTVRDYYCRITQLRENGWKVVVSAYNMPSNAKMLSKQFPDEKIIFADVCSAQIPIKNVVLVAGMFVAIGMLYFTFGK